MPIPQTNKKNRNSQSWRNRKKKYYISRGRSKSWAKKNNRLSGSLNINVFKLKKIIIFSIIGLILAGILFSFIVVAWISRGLPDPNKLIDREIAQSTKIYDRAGETVLYEIHGDEERTMISLDEIPDYVKWAAIAIEDKNFYNHKGISLWGIFRGVVWRTIRGKSAQGGSTLTQQFVKNAILTPERTITRKIKEWILAYKIEQSYTKDEIMQMYLNEIPYGSTAYGVEAASQKYFGKSVRDINLPEAAILAALPQAPSRYSPYGSNIDLLIGRQHYIIDLMYEQDYISEAKRDAGKQYELKFQKPTTNIIAPHFVMYVKEILSEKYGEKMVEQGGLKIYTTLDLYKQKIAEEVIDESAEDNEEQYQANNAALISIDPKTGQILAMVGSKDYFNNEIDGQVNITTSARQPGSSLKPLVYAASFLKGYTPNTILYDVVTNFSAKRGKTYEPHNYDNQEHGPVTIRKALAGSLNIPAVKAIYLAGLDNVLELAYDLGYSTLEDRDRFGLSLTLGGGEVKLIEHANAFGAFAREGVIHTLSPILRVEDKEGEILEELKVEGRKVLDPKISRMINDILSDNKARAYAFGERNWLTLGSRPVAAKTGTTNDYRDAWTIGYTPSIVTGVWVGNNDNSEMKRGAAGGAVAAPIWHDYMDRVLGDTPIEYFRKPEIPITGKPVLDGEPQQKIIYKIDKASGLLATEYTPASMIEEKVYYEPHCILYYVNKDDPLGDAPKNPEKDPQFVLWEDRVQEWTRKEMEATSTLIENELPPEKSDNLHLPENRPEVKIITPGNNQAIMKPFLISRIEATAPRGINRAEYYLNDILLFTNFSYPFNLEKQIDFLDSGFHNLKIRVCDDVDNCTQKGIEFNLILEKKKQAELLKVSILEPSSGLAISNIDFPLNIKINFTDKAQAAKADFYYLLDGSNEARLAASIQPVENNQLIISWNDIPASGAYKLWVETATWDKKTAKSNEVIVIINNINQSEDENDG
ncbi:MAG: penicillin-binding protein [Patescibacteria group bacterium]|nr:penicillin-binding protein [Patescibacteria group bacterium]